MRVADAWRHGSGLSRAVPKFGRVFCPASREVNTGSEVLALPGHLAGFPEPPSGGTLTSVDFEDFVRAERSKLIWFLMSHGASVHQAEEAAQASLIEAWRKWETIVSPRGWVYRVALREYWRSASRPGTDHEESDGRASRRC